MAEYIEREKAIFPLHRWRNIIKNTYGENDEYVKCLDEAIDKIEDVPAADVVPVRHGRNISNSGFLCSECHFGDFGGFHGYNPNYCPNCGAKMDGEA